MIIKEVASRALASLLITERGICGNRAENRAAHDATLATSLRFSLGKQAKKIPTDKSWDFEYWWWNTEPNPRSLSEADSNRTRKCPCFRANVPFPSRALSTEERRGLGWRARKQSLRRTRVRFRVSQLNRRPQIQAASIIGNRSSPGEPQALHNFSGLRLLLFAIGQFCTILSKLTKNGHHNGKTRWIGTYSHHPGSRWQPEGSCRVIAGRYSAVAPEALTTFAHLVVSD